MSKEKVLIIDDNKSITRVVDAIAKKMGFLTAVVHSYRQLEQVITENNEFFCACVDFNLPDAPNGEAIDFVINQGIPAFVLTGQMDEQTRQTILSKPVIDYVPKETIQSFDYVGKLLARLKANEKIRILIVDDSASARIHLRSMLTRHNFLISEALNGVEALKVLETYNDIKLVVTDNEMPVMTGLQLVPEIRKKYEHQKLAIIAISSSNQSILSARFLKSGADDYLSKPFSAEEFYTRIFRNLEFIEHVEEVQFAVDHDFLTKMHNRRYFFEQSDIILNKMKETDSNAVFAILDLDHFKSVNDTYGHDAGDIILVQTAKRLKQHFPECLTARLGGEEFCILFPNTSSEEAIGRLEFLVHHFENFEFEIPDKSLQVTLSIGMADCSDGHISETMKRADQALYRAKQNGRNQLVEAN
ncbi:diguanylate cyclase domain-containing protein [Catenovulum maritimum]|uniref:diguanylate cyclase n=1 Tax=Catenovulum maritimum TaxID=1513271 RepID=A0A0J8JKQ8_9ALTE|nr:diguanylate cyclase [Catenovulum maritimum]KMT65071.1 hypothetical protein XM47_11435 [Catenovulum maritimum]